ncbi:hypothetical protein FCG40_09780 [Fimbriimonadia bacterium ATM]|nr:hypothetical protein [Fimbriimonadia bacterium ATM]
MKRPLLSSFLAAILLAVLFGCTGKTASPPPSKPAQNEPTLQEDTGDAPEIGEQVAPQPVSEPSRPVEDGVRLRFRPEKGKIWKYELRSDVVVAFDAAYLRPSDMQDVKTGFDVGFEVDVREAAKEVRTLRFVSGPITLENGGQSPPQGAQIKIDDRGRPITAPTGMLAGLLLVGVLPFPESGLEAGSAWSTTSVRSSVAGDAEIEETYTLVGREKRHGRDAYRIKMVAKSQDGSISMEGTYFVDVSDGMLISAELTQKARTDRATHPTRGEIPALMTAKTVVSIKE